MKAAVTGGSGFIGAPLVERLLADGHSVSFLSRSAPDATAPKHPKLIYVQADLRDENADLRKFISDADTLFHCAGEITHEADMMSLHVDGTQRLISAARGKIKHWVQLSSVGAYGPHQKGIIDEGTVEAPLGTYEGSKTQSDALVLASAQETAFRLTILRPANVIGLKMPNQSIFQMISAIDRGLFAFIGQPGAMTNYVPVSNVVDALILCASRRTESPEIFNLAQPLPLEAFVQAICIGLDKPLPTLRLPENLTWLAAQLLGPLPGFLLTPSRFDALTSRACYSADKIETILGHSPRISVSDCITEMTRAWKRKHEIA